MPLSPTIDRDNKLPHAQDYGFLSREAISLIQSLSGEIWTDYNTHDPGITLLETVCYALTDLGYRTSFDMQDILSLPKSLPGAWEKVFYTARQILPCNPLTLLDYRKLIIDTEGVKNAWIEKSDDYEILMYLQKKEQEKSEKPLYNLTYDHRKGEELLRLRGLYKVFVDYENHILEEKKEEEVADVIRKKLQFHRNLCEDFVSVASVEYESFSIDSVVQVNEGTDIELITAKIYIVINNFFSPSLTFYSLEQMLERNGSAEEIFEGPILKYGFIDTEDLEKSERYKNVHLSDIIKLISGVEGVIAIKKFTFGNSPSSFSAFTEWINNVKDMQKIPRLDTENSKITFVRSGDRHRPGNEKQSNKERVMAMFRFLQSADFRTRLKGISKDLPVPKGEFMDIADYYPFQNNLPVMYGMTEKYIDDSIDRVSVTIAVDELLDQKLGIKLRRVFTKLLDEAGENDAIEKILQDVLDEPVNDISSVKEVINKLIKNKIQHSLINEIINELFGKDDAPIPLKDRLYKLIISNSYTVSISDKTSILSVLAGKTNKKSLLKITHKEDIEHLNDAYRKHQIAMLGKRKQLALQLKGFLMVFEQIMADHLSKLAHTRELLSFDASVNQSYFPQVLEEIKDVESIFIDFKKYKESHIRLMETEGHYIKTRSGLLDHLMARFSESMDKYSFFMQNYLGKPAGKKLIADKIAFLLEYIPISSYRGKGFDYTNEDKAWNSDNVEGFKKRICRLLGIENYNRRTIAHDSIFLKEISLDDGTIKRHVVILADPDDKESILLESIQYESESEARQILNYILEQGIDRSLYKEEGRKDRWMYQLQKLTPENEFEIVAEGIDFSHRDKRDAAFKRTLEVLSQFSDDENFHLVEHILLRPRIGPREQISKRRPASIDPDTVNLLSVRNVPDKVSILNKEVEELTYKFNITQHKDNKTDAVTVWRVSLSEDDFDVMVVNDDFTFFRHLTGRIRHIREFGADVSNYYVETSVDGLYTFKLAGRNMFLAESNKGYRKKEEIDEQISKLVHYFSYELEHISSQVNEDSLGYYADPYSLQVSIVIPAWHKRFRSPAFMHLLEKTIYMETPSHIHPHIYWLDHKGMKEFEEAYKLWIEELSGADIPDTDIINNMIMALNELRK